MLLMSLCSLLALDEIAGDSNVITMRFQVPIGQVPIAQIHCVSITQVEKSSVDSKGDGVSDSMPFTIPHPSLIIG